MTACPHSPRMQEVTCDGGGSGRASPAWAGNGHEGLDEGALKSAASTICGSARRRDVVNGGRKLTPGGLQVTVARDDGRAPLIAQWGGISLVRDTIPTVLNDNPPRIWSNRRSELVQRLLADACELCGSADQVEVHHIRALKDLTPRGRRQQPEWAMRMASRHRKTLLVCRACHESIHYSGCPTRQSR